MLQLAPQDNADFLGGFPPAAIQSQAAKILASAAFQKSKRLSRFLSYAVKNTLQGNQSVLKETVLGLEVFDRGADFDPRQDPIVRIDARRLRARVSEYYQAEGAGDPIVIEFAPGSYVPRFMSSSGLMNADAGSRKSARGAAREQPGILKKITTLDLLRQGSKQLESYTPEGVIKSATLFERAAAADPQEERAYLGLGLASIWKSILLCEASHTAMARARSAAQRVLELDSAQPEGHALLGFVQAAYDFDFHVAHASFLVALRLDPSSLRVRLARALLFLAPLGMLREAIDELRHIEKQSPEHVRNTFSLGWLLYLARDYAAAAEKLEQALIINPKYVQARYSLGLAYEALGQYQRSDEVLLREEICSAHPLMPLRQEMLRALRRGDRQRALESAYAMEAQYSPGNIDPVAIAGAFSALANHDRTLQWLERAFEDRRYWLIYLKSDPAFDSLGADPRYRQLVAQMGLAAAAGKHGFAFVE